MTTGEWLTRGTISARARRVRRLGAAHRARGARACPTRLIRARWPWTIGCAFFAAHVICAFSYYHDWSHGAAYRETARQTGELTGFHWGGGLFLNYLLGILWVADVVWWWMVPASFAKATARTCFSPGTGSLYFMVFNGTVVFGSGPVRWFGLVLCGGLAALWWWSRSSAR